MISEARTIPEIQQEYGAKASEILTHWHNTLDEIKGDREPEAGAYLDRLSDQQRLELLREQKERSVDEVRARTIDEYREHLESYHGELAERTNYLQERLYKVENTSALSGAATAGEEGLSAMLNIARAAGDKTLARAVFVAAEQRGLGDLVARYFDEADPEARDLYNEWLEAPAAEVLERQREGVETIVHRPSVDSLTTPARVSA
jgi:hypothetical protein